MIILTLISTLYLSSSGDGNVWKLSTNGFDNRWSITKKNKRKYNYKMKFILPLKISFKIQAITPCCSYEQWFSIFKKSGYLLEIKIFRNDSIKTS